MYCFLVTVVVGLVIVCCGVGGYASRRIYLIVGYKLWELYLIVGYKLGGYIWLWGWWMYNLGVILLVVLVDVYALVLSYLWG